MRQWVVYVLFGEHGAYVGITSNLQRRLNQHRMGACKSSAVIGSFEVYRTYKAADYIAASKLERYLHTRENRDRLRELVDGNDGAELFRFSSVLPTTPYELKQVARDYPGAGYDLSQT